MGCGSSSESSKPKKQFRVLTLGVGGSGKSSFQKALRLIYGNGFQEDEVALYKQTIAQNLMLGMRDLVDALNPDDSSKKKNKIPKAVVNEATFFAEADPWSVLSITPEIAEKAKAIWSNDVCRSVLSNPKYKKSEFAEALKHIMENIDRISQPDWQPTSADILHCRHRTVGTLETRVPIDKHEWIVTDAGGQKTERRKWVHELEQQGQNLNAIIYFVALDDYDRKGVEGGILESLEVWDELVNTKVDPKVAVILFLNKKDVFAEKIKQVSISKYFKQYKGGDDFDKAVAFFKDMFLSRVKRQDEIFVHVTCAVDPENVKLVMNAAKEQVFMASLKEIGWGS